MSEFLIEKFMRLTKKTVPPPLFKGTGFTNKFFFAIRIPRKIVITSTTW